VFRARQRVTMMPRSLREGRGIRYVSKSVPSGAGPREDEAMNANRDQRQEQQAMYLPFLPSSYPPAPVV